MMKKFLAALICFSLLLTAVACVSIPQQPQDAPDAHAPNPHAPYDNIISQYTALLTAKRNGDALTPPDTAAMDERSAAIARTLHGIVESCKSAEATENLGYGYKDLDGNGIDELILLTKYTNIGAIFTVSNEQPILLEANYEVGSSFVFATRNRFFMKRKTVTDHIEEVTYYTCRVDGDKMVYDAVYGEVCNQEQKEILERFQIVGGERLPIDQDTFRELSWEHIKSNQPGYTDTVKLLAPRIYLPLVNSVTGENLPVADFSSYAAIRETYKAISTCLDQFHSRDWLMGEYDNLFTFPSDLSFEYYTRLLYAAYHGNRNVGYDEIDLNGDGQDELVLVNEDYSIKAIFTKKDGVPVMLQSLSREVGWLDGQGFIHIDREDYYELEYSIYELTKNGDCNLIYSIAVNQVYRSVTKDGKTEKISFEESLELYDDYCRYSEPFTPNEQTRNVSDLTYTPLTEPTEDPVKAAKDKTWHKYANLEETSEKDFARSNTYVTFENVTTTQMDVNFKYEFVFSYPDPDRDHYLLDDITESSLKITAHAENGVFVFDENGVKGRLEFGREYLWIIFEESTDPRFPVGYHCYDTDFSSIIQ